MAEQTSSWSPRNLAQLAGMGALTAGAAALGGSFSGPDRWYRRLKKPPFQPPPRVFGPVWGMLYALIAYSGWRVLRAPRAPARRRALGLWGLQLGLNAAWTPLFFGLRRPRWALVDLGLLDAASLGFLKAARRVDRRIAWSWAPYLAWIAFASALNFELVRRNR